MTGSRGWSCCSEPPPRRRRAGGCSTRCSSPSPWPVSTASRVEVIAGDLSDATLGRGRELAGIDTVIHCAATVSFEEPLDQALALNSFGPANLLGRLRRAGSDPHFVHVSTAYVADRRSGVVGEDGLPHHAITALDPERLLAEAREEREELERESRAEPRSSASPRPRGATPRCARASTPAERAEELRGRWLLEELSRRGRRRALAEGWPDTYALSKALGERLLTDTSARITIVRPTIIESALRAAAAGLAGGDQGRRPADPRLRRPRPHPPARASRQPDRHRPRRPRRPRLRRRRRPPARGEAAHDRGRQQRPQPAGDRRAGRPHPRILPRQPAARARAASRSRSASSSSSSAARRCARRCAASGSPPPSRGWRSPRRSASPRSASCAATPRWPGG